MPTADPRSPRKPGFRAVVHSTSSGFGSSVADGVRLSAMSRGVSVGPSVSPSLLGFSASRNGSVPIVSVVGRRSRVAGSPPTRLRRLVRRAAGPRSPQQRRTRPGLLGQRGPSFLQVRPEHLALSRHDGRCRDGHLRDKPGVRRRPRALRRRRVEYLGQAARTTHRNLRQDLRRSRRTRLSRNVDRRFRDIGPDPEALLWRLNTAFAGQGALAWWRQLLPRRSRQPLGADRLREVDIRSSLARPLPPLVAEVAEVLHVGDAVAPTGATTRRARLGQNGPVAPRHTQENTAKRHPHATRIGPLMRFFPRKWLPCYDSVPVPRMPRQVAQRRGGGVSSFGSCCILGRGFGGCGPSSRPAR